MRRSPSRSSQVRRRSLWNRGLWLEQLEHRTLLNGQAVPLGSFGSLTLDADSYDGSTILVRFQPDAPEIVTLGGIDIGRELPLVPGLHEVHLAPGWSIGDAVAYFQHDPNVVYAQPNYRVTVALRPNDPRYPEQYALNNTGQTGGSADADIDFEEVWGNFPGFAQVIVAVIDTGVDYNHPDLAANIWTNPGEISGNDIDDDGNGFVDDIHGYDFVNNDADPMDDFGHGTHVAGTIAAVTNNSRGVAGVAWNVKIMALKFLDATGSGFISDAIRALNYALSNGAKISNNSWGSYGFDQAMFNAIQNAASQDHIFVAAAGNDSSNNDMLPFFPASYALANVVAVAATDHNDQLAGFSNFGAVSVDLGAPGVDILSTVPPIGELGDPSGYRLLSGTSMATPHVSGVIALVRGKNPTWNYAQVVSQVLDTGDLIPALAGRTFTGRRLNAYAALTGAPPPDTSGPRVTASSPSGIVTGTVSSVRLTFSESVAPASFDTTDVASFTGPGGSIPVSSVTPVAGSNNRQFDIAFAPRSAIGDYHMVIGPNLTDLAGNLMNQDGDSINGEPIQDQYHARFTIGDFLTFHSTDVPAPLFWLTATGSFLDVTQNVRIADINVTVNIQHRWTGDLALYILSPLGSWVFLSIFNGAGADFQNTTFDDEATIPISFGSPPFAGSYRPDTFFGTRLANFDGQNARGRWELWIENWGFFNGSLTAWSITITPMGGGAFDGGSGRGSAAPAAGDGADAPVFDSGSSAIRASFLPQLGERGREPAAPLASSNFLSSRPALASRAAVDALFAQESDESPAWTFDTRGTVDEATAEEILDLGFPPRRRR